MVVKVNLGLVSAGWGEATTGMRHSIPRPGSFLLGHSPALADGEVLDLDHLDPGGGQTAGQAGAVGARALHAHAGNGAEGAEPGGQLCPRRPGWPRRTPRPAGRRGGPRPRPRGRRGGCRLLRSRPALLLRWSCHPFFSCGQGAARSKPGRRMLKRSAAANSWSLHAARPVRAIVPGARPTDHYQSIHGVSRLASQACVQGGLTLMITVSVPADGVGVRSCFGSRRRPPRRSGDLERRGRRAEPGSLAVRDAGYRHLGVGPGVPNRLRRRY